MAVNSKLCRPMYTTCQEYVHPWTSSCYTASAGLLMHSLQASFRLYVTVYVLALLMRGRKPTAKDIRRTILGILQSTAFIGCHAVGFSLCACLMRNILGHYNFFTFAFLPTFISSWGAILMERPSRRGLLSLYVTNIASETLYYMMVWRGWMKPLPLADVLMFTMSMAWLMFLYRGRHDSRDSLFSLIRYIVGPYEQLYYDKEMDAAEQELDLQQNGDSISKQISDKIRKMATMSKNGKCRRTSGLIFRAICYLCHLYKQSVQMTKQLIVSQYCTHPRGCLYYWLQGGLKVFAVGYGLELSLKILLRIKRMLKQPTLVFRFMKSSDTFKLGAFLGGFAFIYRMISCILRHCLQRDPQYIALPAGFLAGFTFAFYRTNTISLYAMWKSLQILYTIGQENDILPDVPYASIFFHCFSTAILFQAAIFEPQNLRSSYWKFLHNMSGGRVGAMDRVCLDVYGLDSSKMVNSIVSKYSPHLKRDFIF